MVTKENYEEYMLLYTDGELNENEQKEFEAFIILHPEYREEMELYNMARLIPDTTQVFADKEQLLKEAPLKKVTNLKQWWNYGIAAGVAAILFIAFWGKEKLKENVVITTHTIEATIPITEQPGQTTKQEAIAVNHVKGHRNRTKAKQSAVSLPVARITISKTDSIATELAYQGPMLPATIAQIKEINIVDTQKVEIKTVQPELVSNNNIATKKSLLETLPIDEDKRKEIENIQRVVTNTLGQISVAREDIRDNGLALKVGNKELFVVRL